MDTDKPLPTAFWQDLTPEPVSAVTAPTPQEELESWRESFAELGTTVEEAMSKWYSPTLCTYEKVYLFCKGMKEVNDTDAAQKAERTGSGKAEQRAAHKAAVAAANKAWRDAVDARKAAMAQWDNYVTHLRNEFRTLKDSS